MKQTQKEKLFDLERTMRDNALGIMNAFRQSLDIDINAAYNMLSGISEYINEPILQKSVFKENENNYHNLGIIDTAEYEARKKRIAAGDYNFI